MAHASQIHVGVNNSVYNEHIIYVNNDIQKLYKMGMIKYAKYMCEMFDMNKFLPTPSRKK